MSLPAAQADSPPNSSRDQLVAADRRLEHIRCMGCGYSLKGLTLSGKCPECGTSTQISLDFSRDLGGLTSENVIVGLRLHALIAALSVGLFVLVLIDPEAIFGAFVLWIGFTVGTCYLADLVAEPRAGARSFVFYTIVGSAGLTALSPFLVMSLGTEPLMGLILLYMTLGNALQFYLIYDRHTTIAKALAKYSRLRVPIVFRFFTFFVHGVVGLPLAFFVSLSMVVPQGPYFAAGIGILYSLPLHGIWLIWLGVRSAYCAQRLRKWSVAPQPRLPA